MTCTLEILEQKSRQRRPRAALLVGLAVALAVSSGLPSVDPFALICDALTAVVCATLNLFFALSDLLARVGLYPDALQPAASVSPYPALLYASEGMAIDTKPALVWRGTLALAACVLSVGLCAELAVLRARNRPE